MADESNNTETAERWLVVTDFPYEVSDLGRVRRVAAPKPLKPGHAWTGYTYIVMSRNSERHQRLVHVLVAQMFIGPKPDKHEVNHINGIKDDNRIENLEYVTRSENMQHAVRMGLMHPARGERHMSRTHPEAVPRGERHSKARLNDDAVRAIRTRYAAGGITHEKLAAEYGVSPSLLSYVINRKTWRHVL